MSKPKILELEEKVDKIIEQGGDSESSYIKFADGTLIQYGVNYGIDNSYRLITFLIPFVGAPKVFANTTVFDTSYVHLAQVHDIGTESCQISVRYISSSGGAWGIGNSYFNWLAIGRWK